MATYPQTEADFIGTLDDDDFINGGHRTNFIPSLEAALAFALFSKLTAAELATLATQVAADAASAAAGSGTETSVANIRAGAAAQYLSIRRVLEANQPVSLTRATTTNWDMASGINFDLVLNGNVTTIANPTNQVAGKSGVLRIVQDATGGRTVGAWGSNFKWLGGAPTLSTVANAAAIVSYMIWAPGLIYLTYGGDDQ